MQSLHVRANILNLKFGRCSNDVKATLFRPYCSNLYCGQLWYTGETYTQESYSKLKVAYNNSFRKLMGFDYQCSASDMFVSNSVTCFDNLIRSVL